MSVMIENEIINLVKQLDEQGQQRILDYVRLVAIRSGNTEIPRLTPLELMQLPFEERQRLLEASIALSADEDFEIFEANSEEDFDDYD